MGRPVISANLCVRQGAFWKQQSKGEKKKKTKNFARAEQSLNHPYRGDKEPMESSPPGLAGGVFGL